MAPSDDAMEDPDSQGETQTMALGQARSHDTFHRYLHLPFELRSPIRAFAIQAAISNSQNNLPCARLAPVSREWQEDVEKALFSKIRLDPQNEEEVSEFQRYFTEKRKKHLTQLEVAVDDDLETGLWGSKTGLLDISRFMEKAGQLLQHIDGWDFSSDGNKQPSIAFMFASAAWAPGYHMAKFEDPLMGTVSLWDPEQLRYFTRNDIPTNVVLWAIKSEFPSSLNMVTHLTFDPDCVPLAAAKRIVQIMPNLESCNFEIRFPSAIEEGWEDFTDFIYELQASAPSLRQLRLNSDQFRNAEQDVPASMVVFANTLREFSQRLEELHAWPLDIHEAFFLPFSEKDDFNASAAEIQCTWPKLRRLVLRGFCELPSSGPNRATLSSTDLLIAAAKATSVMPKLQSMEIEGAEGEYFYFQREKLKIAFAGFSEDEERNVLAAYAPFVGAEVELVRELDCGDKAPIRSFKYSTKQAISEGMLFLEEN